MDAAGWRRLVSQCPAPQSIIEADADEAVVWADSNGEVHIAPSQCPHLDMPYATEGAVIGDELVCLSHGWCLDGAGDVFKRSMAGRRDDKGAIVLPPLKVVDDVVWVASDFDDRSDRFRNPSE